jgi:hypothetical protein
VVVAAVDTRDAQTSLEAIVVQTDRAFVEEGEVGVLRGVVCHERCHCRQSCRRGVVHGGLRWS